jgi:SAM-dependent methyltransferase
MLNQDKWKPSKVQLRRGRWRASNDPTELFSGSRLILDATLDNLSELIPKYAHGDILDLGCGRVPYYGLYHPYVKTVFCVDWAASSHPSAHLDLVADLTQPLPLPSQSFDTVLATDLLEHLPDPAAIWAEISRLLRPNGLVILTVPFLYWIHEAPHDYHRYTEYALRVRCGENKLEVVDLRAIGGALSTVVDIVSKSLAGRGVPVAVIRPLIALARRRIHGAGSRVYPLGYALVARKPPIRGTPQRHVADGPA